MNVARLREELESIAANRDTITYVALGQRIEPDLNILQFSNAVTPIMNTINAEEHAVGGPLLSAVVVRKDTCLPGKGFFMAARNLRGHDGTSDSELWEAEIHCVHEYWSSRRRR